MKNNIKKRFNKNKYAYIMLIPVLIYYIVFCYLPMFGVIIAFKNYSPIKGILGSDWVGLKHFSSFFKNIYFGRLLKNTFSISFFDLVVNFPTPIILAILLNEVRNKYFKSVVQTVSYFPHFISIVVICGMIKTFTLSDGLITNLLVTLFGINRESMLQNSMYFQPIYVFSSTWQEIGWGSIIYMSALCGIDTQLYEACKVDGGGKLRQLWHVTLPGIKTTIMLMLILRMGCLLSVGSEKVILLYNESIYKTADVISSYVYRKGLQEQNWSYGSAVGLFNSLISVVFVATANYFSKKYQEVALW